MDSVKLGKYEVKTLRVDFDGKNYIELSADNAIQFDAFVAGYKRLYDLAEESEKRISQIEKKYSGKEDDVSSMDMVLEISRENIRTAEESVKIADDVFGAGTARKYFADGYEKFVDFVPNADMMLDFFYALSPIMENFFGKRLEEREALRRKKMAKYQPQDHKRKTT